MSTELQSNSVSDERLQLWKLHHRADRKAFQEFCWESLTISQFESEEGVDDPIAFFITKLNKIAQKHTKNLDSFKKVNKPWFDDTCKKEIDYAKALRRETERQS